MHSPDPPAIEVRLNLEPSVLVTGQPHPISLRGLGRVILFLVFLRGASVGRAKMAQVLWPSEPEEVTSNRLRVSLSRLKAMLGGVILADRTQIRLSAVEISFDLIDIQERLQQALDEVDLDIQFEALMKHSEALRGVAWREYVDLDSSGVLTEGDAKCRQALRQLMETAARNHAWEAIEFVWQLMVDRGDADIEVCQNYLDANNGRGELEAALRKIKYTTASKAVIESLTTYARGLKNANGTSVGFQTSHAQLLGSSLLAHLPNHANLLAELLTTPELQFQMQAHPRAQLQILEAIQSHLEHASPAWVDVQTARLSAYASLYDSDNVIEICRSLFPCEMTPLRASATWMHYSFCMFQVRNWDEAFSAIERAKGIAAGGGESIRLEICLLTEAAYLWHLGRVPEARAIYDVFLQQYSDTEDFTAGVSAAISRVNYAVIEVVYGDIEEARRQVDLAYGQRTRFNLSRALPNLLSLMGLVYARTNELRAAVDFVIEGLKQTYARGSSREGHLNMEWACGVLVVGGLRAEAWQVMVWVNQWRKATKHTRSVCEELYGESLGLQEFRDDEPRFSEQSEYREVMKYLILGLRQVQKAAPMGQ